MGLMKRLTSFNNIGGSFVVLAFVALIYLTVAFIPTLDRDNMLLAYLALPMMLLLVGIWMALTNKKMQKILK